MRTRLFTVLVTAALLAIPLAPARATPGASADVGVLRVKVTDITTGSTTTATVGDKLRFVAVVKNYGPDAADFVSSSSDWAICLASPYLVSQPDASHCVFAGLPNKGKINAMKHTDKYTGSPGVVSMTFCVATTGGEGDPDPANDCGTGSITVH